MSADNSSFKLMLAISLAILSIVLLVFIAKKIDKINCLKGNSKKFEKKQEVNMTDVQKDEIINDEIDKLPVDSKNAVIQKVLNLERKFDEASAHINKIIVINDQKTIDDNLKENYDIGGFFNDQGNFTVRNDGNEKGGEMRLREISGVAALRKYMNLLIANEMHKNKSRMHFTFMNKENKAQVMEIEKGIAHIENSYKIFFDNIKTLKNKNDFETFGLTSHDNGVQKTICDRLNETQRFLGALQLNKFDLKFMRSCLLRHGCDNFNNPNHNVEFNGVKNSSNRKK